MDEMELKTTPSEQIKPACPLCNNRSECQMYVVNYPDIMVKCIWFGWIEKHYNELKEDKNS